MALVFISFVVCKIIDKLARKLNRGQQQNYRRGGEGKKVVSAFFLTSPPLPFARLISCSMIYEQKHQKMPPSWCLFPQKCLMRSLAKDISLRVDIERFGRQMSVCTTWPSFEKNVVYWTLYLPSKCFFLYRFHPQKLLWKCFFLPISRSKAEKLRSGSPEIGSYYMASCQETSFSKNKKKL